MPRDGIQTKHRGVGEVGHTVDAGDRGHRRPAADIDEDLLRGQPLAADLELVRGDEARVAAMHGAVLGRAQGCFGRRTP